MVINAIRESRQGKGRETWGYFRQGGQGGLPEEVMLGRDGGLGKDRL